MASVTVDFDEMRAVLRWRHTGIPRRLWGRGIEERLDLGAPFELVGEWVRDLPVANVTHRGIPVYDVRFGGGLLLVGAPGTGKTTAACAALTSVNKDYGHMVFFIRFPDYLKYARRLESSSSDPDIPALGICEAVRDSYVVALDDVGHEYSSGSGYGESVLTEILRTRYDNGSPTILTTNLSSEEWEKHYDAPLRSFINQACPPIVFDGPDRRMPRAE